MDLVAHFDAMEAGALGGKSPLASVSSSWHRSANLYGIDQSSRRAPSILTAPELTEHREPLSRLVHLAREEIDGLYKLVRDSGYAVLVCDSDGVAIDCRGEERWADEFKHWGIWLGGVWSEDIEGTNGIGTCIQERRPVTVHLSEHFRSRHTGLSCSGAPVFNSDGSLLAVVDVSAMEPSLSQSAHGLTGPLTIAAARSIEERLFRDEFRRSSIAALSHKDGRAMLLAFDDDFRIVGADRRARRLLNLDPSHLREGPSLWRYFERNATAFRANGGADFALTLSSARRDESLLALVTPPHNAASCGLTLHTHTRPRLDLLATLGKEDLAPPVRGGLSGVTIRKIRGFIDAHLGEPIDVAALARIAGLSVFHFSRQFRLSTGLTPHRYVMQRRLDGARVLLETTQLPLSEIAAATGFADQGHLTRRFRQRDGTTPHQHRQSRRPIQDR